MNLERIDAPVSEHDFRLVLHALFQVGCHDATVAEVDGVGYADFIRQAPSFGEALRSAIDQVESVPGLTTCAERLRSAPIRES